MSSVMERPFSKSMPSVEKCKRLLELISNDDILGILINADPDAMASAVALKRLFWRKARKVQIFHINPIKRADNLASIKLLKLDQKMIGPRKAKNVTKWAIVDSQPHHNEVFQDQVFEIIIDHHPLGSSSKAPFVDIKEDYGATSTLMTEYLRAAKIKPSPRLATALFYGIKTDTGNFTRDSAPNDINAFRYLYPIANMNIINKIEASEMTRKTLDGMKVAIDRLNVFKGIGFIHMGEVENTDILVIIADFFMKLAEVTWSVVSGIFEGKLIIIFRNAGFKGDAGKSAQRIFGHWGGTAGGHRAAARAEIPIENIKKETKIAKLDQLLFDMLRDLSA